MTLSSGAAMVALELYISGEWLFQVRGLSTLLKVCLLLLIPLWNRLPPTGDMAHAFDDVAT